MISFGPVPSRRLGRSLGINNIPPKYCTYSCIYCQVGRTLNIQVERRSFYQPDEILRDVQNRIENAQKVGEAIDYLTIVPDGEPTLDVNLGREIDLLRPLGIHIAAITNSSLIWREDVRDALMKCDWVSLKVDAIQERTWLRINRPHRSLQLPKILDGMLEFAKGYKGILTTETMLVRGINDGAEHVRELALFLNHLQPSAAYLAIPIRPPAEARIQPPDENTINEGYQIFSDKLDRVEYLIGYEGNAFSFTGNVEEDLLSITAVHPMRKEAVSEFLAKAHSGWPVVDKLIALNQLIETEYEGRKFYVRRLNSRQKE